MMPALAPVAPRHRSIFNVFHCWETKGLLFRCQGKFHRCRKYYGHISESFFFEKHIPMPTINVLCLEDIGRVVIGKVALTVIPFLHVVAIFQLDYIDCLIHTSSIEVFIPMSRKDWPAHWNIPSRMIFLNVLSCCYQVSCGYGDRSPLSGPLLKIEFEFHIEENTDFYVNVKKYFMHRR